MEDQHIIRVRQTIPHVIMDIEGVKPSPLPSKVFTEKYPAVKYPRSVVKQKAYSQFGLSLEEEVALALKAVYKDKFVGDISKKSFDQRFPYLSSNDMKKFVPELKIYIAEIVEYFEEWYPFDSILRITYQGEFELSGGSDSVLQGHPDIVVWLDENNIVIYDVKVFARTTININKEVRLQLCSYVALARSSGLCCDYVGVIMPWSRPRDLHFGSGPVVEFSVEKWKESKFLDILINSMPKVLYQNIHYLKWSLLLESFSVGSHIHRDMAIAISKKSQIVKTPFQIFLYGNNPSASMEAKGKEEIARIKPDFSKNNIFVHAPYNVTLCSPAEYIVSTIKTYLNDAHRVGAKGVIIHTGHHPDEVEGLKIMRRNMDSILSSIHRQTPLIIETPCGNKNEMLNTATKMMDFVRPYPEHLVGICIDTCHVFVSGVNPVDYISDLVEEADLSSWRPNYSLRMCAMDRVGLIHFNGSRKKFGCCADGHAHVTTINNIPDEELESVLLIARLLKIPCITE